MSQWRLVLMLCLAVGIFAVAHAQRSNVQFGLTFGTPGYYSYFPGYQYGYLPYSYYYGAPFAYNPYYWGGYYYPTRPGLTVVLGGRDWQRWPRAGRGGWWGGGGWRG